MNNTEDNSSYNRAKKRVEREKGFHSHLTAYIIINIAILLINIDFDNHFSGWVRWHMLVTPLFWGIGLLIHGLSVFGPRVNFVKKWEDRKIKELMDKEDYKYDNDGA